MKKEQVQIGQVYSAKVSGKVVPVRIEKERPASGGGGWDAVNLHTNRPVRIKSAQRLRSRITVPGTKADATDKPGTQPARKKLTKKELTSLRAHLKAHPSREQADAEQDGARAEVGAKPRRKRSGPSLIEAALQVLGERGEPMTCSQMIDAIFRKRLWSTTGKTPAQTLYSAIIRELQKKGDAARFRYVERGKFALKGSQSTC
ncbi:MAG TPA: winged helix-turn-helix domain-containing protein [Phycisphaeraceae bacterium]